MSTKTALTLALPVIGGINWGLVGIGKFDLVAQLTGNEFGETNPASRVIYGAVGAASLIAAFKISQA
jgi:uncharacterized membrane protein YuzA (DUF378 family)